MLLWTWHSLFKTVQRFVSQAFCCPGVRVPMSGVQIRHYFAVYVTFELVEWFQQKGDDFNQKRKHIKHRIWHPNRQQFAAFWFQKDSVGFHDRKPRRVVYDEEGLPAGPIGCRAQGFQSLQGKTPKRCPAKQQQQCSREAQQGIPHPSLFVPWRLVKF